MGELKYTLDFCNSLPKFDRSVSLVCWAYNEEELVGGFLDEANKLLKENVEDYEIIIVDDASTDRTNQIIKDTIEDIPQIKLIRNQTNLDVGLSSHKAINAATKEFLFWQTIDWSYDISFFRLFLELLRTYDVVAGVRLEPVKAADKLIEQFWGIFKIFGIKHLTRRSDNLPKALVSVVNYVLVRLLYGVGLSDFQNVVFYPTKLIQTFDFESKSSFTNPECLIKAYWKGASIMEVPISFLPRQAGSAKGTRLKAIMSSVGDVLGLWFKWIVLNRRDFLKKGSIRRLRPQEWEKT